MYHGTQHIDELVSMRLKHRRAYIHQDERSECEPAATAKACTTRASGRQAGSQQAGTTPAQRRANYNVTNITDLTGRVLERYYYSPYGELEVSIDAHFFDYDEDGVVDDFDLAAATTGGDCWNDYDGQAGACKRLDANADREIDADDYNAIAAYVNSLPADADLQRTPSSSRSLRGNPFGHQGLVLDAEIGSYQNRARQFAPARKRFMQMDALTASTKDPLEATGILWEMLRESGLQESALPFVSVSIIDIARQESLSLSSLLLPAYLPGQGYHDGMNLYQYVTSSPLHHEDPEGLACRACGRCCLYGCIKVGVLFNPRACLNCGSFCGTDLVHCCVYNVPCSQVP
jgi:hypothetical protein